MAYRFWCANCSKAGLLHEDVNTVAGFGLSRYTLEPWLNNGELQTGGKGWDYLYSTANAIASFLEPFSIMVGQKC
ncbi:hypothetical protein ACNKHR_25115 [Shigella flexneri]